jgi:RNA polymerase sigma-70 factor (ECF subfamily)
VTPDDELFTAWCEGDAKCGAELFRRHFEALRRFFVNKVDDDVEDLVQRTFMACIEGRERFERRSSFRGYLLGIAHNMVRKHWAERGKVGRRYDEIDELAIADLGAGPSSVLARNQNERMLLDALRAIPLRDQIVVELFFWEGLNGREIGEVLDIPEDTVRTRLRRAKQALTKQLRRMERLAGVPESTDEQLEDWARAVRVQISRV